MRKTNRKGFKLCSQNFCLKNLGKPVSFNYSVASLPPMYTRIPFLKTDPISILLPSLPTPFLDSGWSKKEAVGLP